MLTFDFAVNDHYTEVRKTTGEFELTMPAPRRQYVAVTRRNFVVRRYELSLPEFELLDALSAGETLGDALFRSAIAAEKSGVSI